MPHRYATNFCFLQYCHGQPHLKKVLTHFMSLLPFCTHWKGAGQHEETSGTK